MSNLKRSSTENHRSTQAPTTIQEVQVKFKQATSQANFGGLRKKTRDGETEAVRNETPFHPNSIPYRNSQLNVVFHPLAPPEALVCVREKRDALANQQGELVLESVVIFKPSKVNGVNGTKKSSYLLPINTNHQLHFYDHTS